MYPLIFISSVTRSRCYLLLRLLKFWTEFGHLIFQSPELWCLVRGCSISCTNPMTLQPALAGWISVILQISLTFLRAFWLYLGEECPESFPVSAEFQVYYISDICVIPACHLTYLNTQVLSACNCLLYKQFLFSHKHCSSDSCKWLLLYLPVLRSHLLWPFCIICPGQLLPFMML